jgi:hypothetical protein
MTLKMKMKMKKLRKSQRKVTTKLSYLEVEKMATYVFMIG